MEIDKNDIDIDRFIKGKINSRMNPIPGIEPSPEFFQTTMGKIYRVEARRQTVFRYGWIFILTVAPFAIKHLWMVVRHDYFSLSKVPFSDLIVPTYQFAISYAGDFALITTGIFASALFAFKYHKTQLNESLKSARTV